MQWSGRLWSSFVLFREPLSWHGEGTLRTECYYCVTWPFLSAFSHSLLSLESELIIPFINMEEFTAFKNTASYLKDNTGLYWTGWVSFITKVKDDVYEYMGTGDVYEHMKFQSAMSWRALFSTVSQHSTMKSYTLAPFTLALLSNSTYMYQACTKIDSVNIYLGLGLVLLNPDFKVGSGPVLSFDLG